jgi:serine/threonine-protein kinase PpkA
VEFAVSGSTVDNQQDSQSPLENQSPFELAGYSDIRQIGAGGMATVYSATQVSFNRKVAIKVLLPAYASDPEFAQRFLREAQTVASLSHPHIIPVYDFGQRDGTFYMVMEHMTGGDLATWIKRGLGEDEALAIISSVAAALHFAHEKGFVHRDVKPDNIMFREDGSAVLTDFGIARKQSGENQMTVAGQILGTPKYMSPEQLQGREIDGRSDIYSLGIMFYEMLCRKAPYEDEDFMALAMLHIQAPLPRLPPPFTKYQNFFERMVAKQPEHRFQNGMEIVKIIQQVRSGKSDVGVVDSASAAQLRKALQTNEGDLAEDSTIKADSGVRITREIMIDLQDMDPLLDEDWERIVSSVFSKLGPAERKYVYNQFVKPKGIVYDAEKKTFFFGGRPSVATVAENTLRNSGLQSLAGKLLKTQQSLRNTRDLHIFADMMEGGLSAIERYNTEENLNVQKEKVALRDAYLADLVPLVRNAQFDVPASRRNLTVESIKNYIIEAYLRHQMQGYRFKTLHLSKLMVDEDPFLSQVVAPEMRIRQCHLIRTRRYFYLVGPVQTMGQDPYSIRRFLQEDTALGGQVIYFNAVVLDLENIADKAYQEESVWAISRIVTLERQLSGAIVDLVKDFETQQLTVLRPLLLKEVTADGTDIEEAIHLRLMDYERKLSLLVMGKLPKAILELAKTRDDFEYLYFSLRNLVIELACDVRDFAAQSTSVWSDKAEEMDYRMMAYLRLLDKRKDTLFAAQQPDTPKPGTDPVMLMEELKSMLDKHEEEIENLNVKLAEVIRESTREKGAFMRWLDKVTGADKKKVTSDDVRGQITAVMRKCMLEIIRLQKRYPVVTVYLEFEGIAQVNVSERHYALAHGKEGIARLPKLVTLNEDKELFDIGAVKKSLEEDLFTGNWRGGNV